MSSLPQAFFLDWLTLLSLAPASNRICPRRGKNNHDQFEVQERGWRKIRKVGGSGDGGNIRRGKKERLLYLHAFFLLSKQSGQQKWWPSSVSYVIPRTKCKTEKESIATVFLFFFCLMSITSAKRNHNTLFENTPAPFYIFPFPLECTKATMKARWLFFKSI